MIDQLILAKKASKEMAFINKEIKHQALKHISDALLKHADIIIQENKKDIIEARNNGMSESMIDRLTLDYKCLNKLSLDLLKLIKLDDPIGKIIKEIKRDDGLIIKQISVPIGVIAVIYESRPLVTIDIIAMCIKTNNVCMLKGGKEAICTNRILVDIVNEAIKDLLPENTITLIETRKDIDVILQANDYIDVIIPRGSSSLIQYVINHTTIEIIKTGEGICHLYIDEYADMNKAISIAINAKIQRPSVCNAIETILVHQNIKHIFLPLLNETFNNVLCYADQESLKYIQGKQITDEHYKNEYNDYICNIKVVNDIDEAINHIEQYSSKHSESIVTENKENAKYFMERIDSACVYHNASTRFSDGGEYGFVVEAGISIQKLHARGPMGIETLTSAKYIIYGNNHIR